MAATLCRRHLPVRWFGSDFRGSNSSFHSPPQPVLAGCLLSPENQIHCPPLKHMPVSVKVMTRLIWGSGGCSFIPEFCSHIQSVNRINPLKTVELLLCKTRVSDGLSRPRVGSAGLRRIWYETISCRWYRNLVFWKYRFCLEIFLYILDLSNW